MNKYRQMSDGILDSDDINEPLHNTSEAGGRRIMYLGNLGISRARSSRGRQIEILLRERGDRLSQALQRFDACLERVQAALDADSPDFDAADAVVHSAEFQEAKDLLCDEEGWDRQLRLGEVEQLQEELKSSQSRVRDLGTQLEKAKEELKQQKSGGLASAIGCVSATVIAALLLVVLFKAAVFFKWFM